MKLAAYIAEQARAKNSHKTWQLKELAEKSGISYGTLVIVERGGKMDSYKKAKLVEQATDGKVTIRDLCDEEA